MKVKPSTLLISGGVLIIVAVAIYASMKRPAEPVADLTGGTIYYTGPMRAKNGTTYGTEDGKAADAPAGEVRGTSQSGPQLMGDDD